MRKRVGRLALRFAQGPGRQSGVWALCAAALAALPFLALIVPGCNSLLACGSSWDRVLFIPRLLFMPMILLATILAGTWWAQRRHARIDHLFFAQLDARSDQPDRPPGEFETTVLDADLAKRTMRGAGQGALLGGLAMVPFVFTKVALRRCDPWSMSGGYLPVCSDPVGWTDMVLAMEVWVVLVLGLLTGLVWMTRSTSIVVRGLPKRRRRFLRGAARA